MGMFEIYVSGPWVAAADDQSAMPSNHPRVADDHQLSSWEDVTGQETLQIIPAPNTYTLRAIVSSDVLAMIDQDARYDVLSWEEISE